MIPGKWIMQPEPWGHGQLCTPMIIERLFCAAPHYSTRAAETSMDGFSLTPGLSRREVLLSPFYTGKLRLCETEARLHCSERPVTGPGPLTWAPGAWAAGLKIAVWMFQLMLEPGLWDPPHTESGTWCRGGFSCSVDIPEGLALTCVDQSQD